MYPVRFCIELTSGLSKHGRRQVEILERTSNETRKIGDLMTQNVPSNVDVYAAIAEEAFADMERRTAEGRKPKADGKGWVISFDPTQKSFKSALVYITFSALWLEAILHLRITRLHGKSRSKTVGRKTYEEKLKILGVNDEELSCSLAEFRALRREIIHEKAFFDQNKFRVAQDEAQKVQQLMLRVRDKLAELGS